MALPALRLQASLDLHRSVETHDQMHAANDGSQKIGSSSTIQPRKTLRNLLSFWRARRWLHLAGWLVQSEVAPSNTGSGAWLRKTGII
jgi:hypothetical protein